MGNLIKIFFIIAILIFEFYMFHFSIEIGAVSLVLIIATFCIGFVINKITTIVEQPILVNSSEPFRDSSKNTYDKTNSDTGKKSDSENLIPGVDSSIFEQFRKKFNLKHAEIAEDENIEKNLNSQNSISATKAYQKAVRSEESENFDKALEEVDQVKVTLSENVKILKELQGEKVVINSSENFEEKLETSASGEVEIKKNLGTGEEALELLTKKHQALKNKKNSEFLGAKEEGDEDLFADEHVRLSGGETLIEEEKEEIFEEDIISPSKENESYEDEEGLELSLRQQTPLLEKSDEAEGLLKLATKACEAGKIEEAKAGLKSYFILLHELEQKPSKNVLQLAEKLEISFESANFQPSSNFKEEFSDSAQMKLEKDINKEPEKTDYSAVMDGIVKTLEKKEAYDEALPLLKDLLKFNRDRVNISAMDPLFERIEQAHASMNNNKELVNTYKEHLAIKQQLDDMEGELRLLELIRSHYADFGDQKAAARYSAESQRVRAELNKN